MAEPCSGFVDGLATVLHTPGGFSAAPCDAWLGVGGHPTQPIGDLSLAQNGVGRPQCGTRPYATLMPISLTHAWRRAATATPISGPKRAAANKAHGCARAQGHCPEPGHRQVRSRRIRALEPSCVHAVFAFRAPIFTKHYAISLSPTLIAMRHVRDTPTGAARGCLGYTARCLCARRRATPPYIRGAHIPPLQTPSRHFHSSRSQ